MKVIRNFSLIIRNLKSILILKYIFSTSSTGKLFPRTALADGTP